MSNAPEGFVALKSQAKGRWYPNKQGDSKETLADIQSSDQTFIQGYYVGSEQIETKPNQMATLHTLKFTKVGNAKSILSDEPMKEHDDVSFFGSMVVNEQLAKVTTGQMVYIRWDGKVAPKKAGGSHYNTWTVAVNPNVEVWDFNSGTTVAASEAAKAPVQNNSTEALSSDDADDDLPF